MTSVGIREAKAHLSRLLREVRAGREVLITDHGRAIGKIVPVAAPPGSMEALERELELCGVIGKRGRSGALPRPAKVPAEAAQRLLQDDRND